MRLQKPYLLIRPPLPPIIIRVYYPLNSEAVPPFCIIRIVSHYPPSGPSPTVLIGVIFWPVSIRNGAKSLFSDEEIFTSTPSIPTCFLALHRKMFNKNSIESNVVKNWTGKWLRLVLHMEAVVVEECPFVLSRTRYNYYKTFPIETESHCPGHMTNVEVVKVMSPICWSPNAIIHIHK